ncbi:MAG: response regulator, partial [Nitrospira sp.]|nr:response regulator [Nitrospira sp.]
MTTLLRVLHLESHRHESDRIETMLAKGDIPCVIHRVESRAAFASALTDGQIDLILAEFNLPRFDGRSALELAQRLAPDVPVIFVSATLQGMQSLEQLDRGATDCFSGSVASHASTATFISGRNRSSRNRAVCCSLRARA